mmetsp:Transcript_711/g.3270  ORF Transcript_711/g.3270 Transcript_711/m.3270 type:complete len:200 (+) Transcript_711:279-878(+)
MAHSSKNIRLAFFSKPHAANTGSATMKQKSSSTSGHHANVPGLFSRTRCTYTAQHANRLPAIHGRFGRHATHIPLTMNSLRASSTFMPPGTGHCSVCLALEPAVRSIIIMWYQKTCGGERSLPVPGCARNPNLSRNTVTTQGTAFSKMCVTRHPSLMYSQPSSTGVFTPGKSTGLSRRSMNPKDISEHPRCTLGTCNVS